MRSSAARGESRATAQINCLKVAAYLEGACSTGSTPAWAIPALPTGDSYNGPNSSQATLCTCNSVVYSLISACAACQGLTWRPWSFWIESCPATSVTLAGFPLDIPEETAVPAWAFLNISKADTFAVAAVGQDQGPDWTHTATTIPPAFQTATAPQFWPTTTTVPAFASDNGSHSHNHTGAIIGGSVVAGVVLLGLLLGYFVYRIRRAQQKKINLTRRVKTWYAAQLWSLPSQTPRPRSVPPSRTHSSPLSNMRASEPSEPLVAGTLLSHSSAFADASVLSSPTLSYTTSSPSPTPAHD